MISATFEIMRILLLLLLISPFRGFGQNHYLLYLSDKQNAKPIELSDRAIARREKNNVAWSEHDLDLSSSYLQTLSEQGQIKGSSRWLNAVHYVTSLSEDEIKMAFPFVLEAKFIEVKATKIRKDGFESSIPKSIDYNVADTQIMLNGIDCLHDQGFRGQGVYLAVIDAGFKGMDTISYFDSTYLNGRVLDTYDFVNGTNIYDYSSHGTAVSSCIFGFGQTMGSNNYSGGAPEVDVALYVSEDVFSETLIEEFNLVQALERCDVEGVDIANISLGYTTFDNPADDHDYSDLDGNTTIAAQGVNTAASKGIIVVAAAGNSGPGTISTPCDSDSCLCVGAVNNNANYAPFSSVGPNADSQVKPDVASTGWNTWLINDAGQLVTGNGTSFASPMLAGGVACLIGANPGLNAMDIIDAVRESGHQYLSPDIYLGYGVADFCVASNTLGLINGSQELVSEWIRTYPNPFGNTLTIQVSNKELIGTGVELIDMCGIVIRSFELSTAEMELDLTDLSSGLYQLRAGEISVSVIKH
jgi:hypothetical protein